MIDWARRLRVELQPLLDQHGDRVHFRPSSTGVTMVGLLPERPQRGEQFANLTKLAQNFEGLFDTHCRDVEHGRVTGEKALQSFLISEAQSNRRRLVSLNRASAATDNAVELWFVTDEISLPVDDGKSVCDLLALRRDDDRCTPVLIELKDSRQLTRLVEQVEGYAKLIDEHANLFAQLFGALLGETITFDQPTEKWIVWPAVGKGPDPRTQELLARGIRLCDYALEGGRYSFVVGPGRRQTPAGPAPRATVSIGSKRDPRLTDIARIGAGEGYATYSGNFEGKPAFIVDGGTMNDLLDADDGTTDSVTVHLFDSEAARDIYVGEMRERSP